MSAAARKTMGDFVEANALHFPDMPAFVFGDQVLTHGEFAQRALKLGSVFHRLGARRQDRIAIMSKNRLEFNQVYAAGEIGGFITTTVNFRMTAPEVEYVINDSAPAVLLFEQDYASLIQQLVPKLKSVKAYICLDGPLDWAGGFEELLQQGDDEGPPFRASEDDIVYLIYTSGTTGRPKGCMLAHRQERFNSYAMAFPQGPHPADRTLMAMPYFHIGAKRITNAQMLHGGTTYIHNGFDVRKVMKTIARDRINVMLAAPIMVQAIVEDPDLHRYDLSSLRRIIYGSSAMPTPVIMRAAAVLGDVLVNNYGQTEICGTALMPSQHRTDGSDEDRNLIASIGQPLPDHEIRIVGDEGEDCPVGVAGEILIRSPGAFRGYWNNSVATLETIRDGWVHTGDVGRLDERGFLFLVDRKKDMIISGGENIYSREVEEALASHVAVSEVAVIGVPDERWGESVRAIVVCRPGFTVTEEDIVNHCRSLIASYKKPKSIIFVDVLPRLPSGKTNKIELRLQYGATFGRAALG